ncbi:MAG: oligopeptide transport system permease protein [Candidatus Azotimanducaceae bacterium]|jgi:oligopeptide transport system permease protein|tara:strand:- start:7276 stop:8682 length:1407 start_codon:yes stop_codon:yes gene_type:complete
MNRHPELQADDFLPEPSTDSLEQLSRPSLSYWQDAWIRLKKNTRAIISLYLIIGLALFTVLGPWLWTKDPSAQDLDQISQAPALPKTALLVSDYLPWTPPIAYAHPAEPAGYPDTLDAVTGFAPVGTPNTQSIRFTWLPVKDAGGYSIYRSETEPTGLQGLGLPLETLEAGNIIGFEDRLNLKSQTYFYSIIPTDGFDEFDVVTTIKVTPLQSITVSQALERGLTDPTDEPGRSVLLDFHPFGTDYLGRDMLARLMQGARVSLFIGVVAPFVYVLFGVFYGGFAGYLGGKIDQLLMRFADFVVALPFLLFMILFKIGFGIGPGESGILPMLVALILLLWPSTARLVRGQVLKIREQGYIEAARLLGGKPSYLIARHIIPNTMGVILVTLTFAVPSAIFTEAFLSFIGMGVAPPTPSWGSMCNEGVKTMLSHPHELFFPALFISITVLAFNLLGDGLTEALDSKMRSRE